MSNNPQRDARRAEQRRRRRGDLANKVVRYTYAPLILKFEKRCFGWHYEGHTITEYDDGYTASYNEYSNTVNVTHNTHIVKRAYFTRPKVFPKHPLFLFTEIIESIFGVFRRIAITAMPAVIIIMIILGFVMSNDQSSFQAILIPIIVVYAILIGGSLLLAGLGKLWRVLFHLDERCDQILEENGFVAWSDTFEGDHF